MRTSSHVIWVSLGLALAMSACGGNSDGDDDDSGSGGTSSAGKGGSSAASGGTTGGSGSSKGGTAGTSGSAGKGGTSGSAGNGGGGGSDGGTSGTSGTSGTGADGGTGGIPGLPTECADGSVSLLSVPKCDAVFTCIIESDCASEADPEACVTQSEQILQGTLCYPEAMSAQLEQACDALSAQELADYPECAP